MNIIARGALWGAVIFAIAGAGFATLTAGASLRTEPHTASQMALLAAEAGAGAAIFGAVVGGAFSILGHLVEWVLQLRKPVPPIVQYDAPQEGVWPPPPIVPGDSEKENHT